MRTQHQTRPRGRLHRCRHWPLALAACSAPASEPNPAATRRRLRAAHPVKLQLQWLPQAQFAGYYVALDQGYFEEEGFDDVEIVPSGGDIVPQDALVGRRRRLRDRLGARRCSARSRQGVELTDIAQVFQKSGTLQVSWADDGITSVADFEGKRIGSWGFGNEWEIFAAMAAEDLDASTVSITTQDFNMNALLDRDVDAAQAMTYNEWAQILEVVNPDDRRAVPAGGLRRRQLRRHRGRHAPGRDLGRHRPARRRPGVRGRRRAVPQGRHQGLDLRAGQPGGGRDDHRTTPRSTPRQPSRSAPCTSCGR